MPGLDPGIHVLISARKTWMAGTSPGHDGKTALPLGHRTDSTVKQREGVRPRSRGIVRPSFAETIRPQKQRAQGKPGARCTRGLVCNVRKQKRTRAYRSSGGIPAFPARWVTACFELSPVNGSFATVAPRDSPRSLAPAPRRQDHTTSPSASGANVSCAIRVHRISPRVRDVANAPLVDEMRGIIRLIWPAD